MMPRVDASIAFSAQDNLSKSVTTMKNALDGLRDDVDGLQQRLTALDNTRLRLKNVDLKQAKKELDEASRALRELGDDATETDRQLAKANFDRATQNYSNLNDQLTLVSRNAKQARSDLLDATSAVSSLDNRASRSSRGGQSGILAALVAGGVGDMAGDAVLQIAGTAIGSAYGQDLGSLLSSGLSGAASGAAIGSVIPGVGTAVGAAIGGAVGLATGAAQVYESEDEAFRSYYSGLYSDAQTRRQEQLTSGSSVAAQRELDAIAFDQLLGEGTGGAYLSSVRDLAASTPLEYDQLTAMSRALATGFGDTPERMLELLTAIGDAGSAVGLTAQDMEEMARAMSRMQSSGKTTLEYLNIFQDRNVDVVEMLAEAMGTTQDTIYDQISRGEIDGRDAVSIIQAALQDPSGPYAGAMDLMAQTYIGLTSTLQDAMTEISSATGTGYNEARISGLQAEIDAYGGALGTALQELGSVQGANQAYLDNLREQYTREALSAVLLGQGTTLYDTEDQDRLRAWRQEYLDAQERYAAGDRDAGLDMEALAEEARAMATAAYESSEQYQAVADQQEDLISSMRELADSFDAWTAAYGIQQEQTRGRMAVYDGTAAAGGSAGGWDALVSNALSVHDRFFGHASGLRRVPYDNYAALLHEGERVLTAREAREMDRQGGGSITVNIGGSWSVRSEEDIDAIAEAIARRVRLAQAAGVRS